MATTYMTKREAKAMETRIMNAMDSKFNEVLEAIKTNKQSADEVSEEKTTEKSEAKPQKSREEKLTESYGTLEDRRAYIEFKKSVMAELKALGEKNGKWIPKGKKYNEALKKAMKACKNQKLNKTEVKKVWTAYAK